MHIVRYGAILLALLGLVGLWIAARSTELPVVQIQDIESTMNWAYVRVQGVVSRQPAYDNESGHLRFWLDDGTGEILVGAYRRESQALFEVDRIPLIGDVVAVEGTLKIQGDLQSITIHVPTSLTLERPTPRACMADEIGIGDVTQKVRIRGQVCGIRYPYEGLTVLTVRDETGQIDVTYTADLVRLSGVPPSVEIGDLVEASGAVTHYRDQLQISLGAAGALHVLSRKAEWSSVAVRRLSLAEIPSVQDGETVSVDAQIVRAVPFSAGIRLLLQEGDAKVPLVFWQNLYDACPDRQYLVPGAWVSVHGKVETYQGERELVPERAEDVTFVEMRELPPVPHRAIRDLTTDHAGQSCEVEGLIAAIQSFSSGTRWVVSDGTGDIVVLLWQNVLDGLSGEEVFEKGSRVRVSGEVAIYKGEIEIVPAVPGDIVWLAAAPTPIPIFTATPVATATPTKTPVPTKVPTATPTVTSTSTPGILTLSTGKVTREYLGQEVIVEGQIVEITQFSTGVKCYLDDGTGSVALWIPQALFTQLPSQAAWIVGNAARARGTVEEYNDEIEVVPQASDAATITGVAAPVPPEIVRMADLGLDHVGQRVTVEGEIVEVRPFSQGVKYLLDDGSGKLTLLLWQSVLDTMALSERDRLVSGVTVQAAGKVNEYRGELEIVPGIASDIVFR